METKSKVYQACILSILLYGSESWVPLQRQMNQLDSFHHRCIRNVLGITNSQQWAGHITALETRQRWGDLETATDKVRKRRLEWLGNLARLPDHRIPKMALFGWLPQLCPQGGPRKRWRDTIRRNLKRLDIREDRWNREARDLDVKQCTTWQ